MNVIVSMKVTVSYTGLNAAILVIFFLDSIIFKSYFMILIDNQNTCILLCTGWYQVSLGLPGIASFLSHCIKRFENLIFFCHDSIYSTSYIATAIREFFE